MIAFAPFLKRITGKAIREVKKGISYERNGYFHVLTDFPVHPDIKSTSPRINLILPSVHREHITGGPATLINYILAIKAKFPDFNIRLLPVMVPFDGHRKDLPDSLHSFYLDFGKINSAEKDSILCKAYTKTTSVPIRENDVFIASMWPTFYLALGLKHQQEKLYGIKRPIQYMIQDYESSALFSWSTFFLMAEQTYTFPDETIAVVGTKALSEYLETQGYRFLKKYTFDPFPHAILTDIPPPDSKKELCVIYGRPDTPRNCFDLIYEALLDITAKHPSIAERVEFVSVGEKHANLPLNNRAILKSRGFLPVADYKALLANTSVACFFVISPHTGYVGLEFAHAGALTITNSFRTKSAADLHPNVREPDCMTPKSVGDALIQAIQETWRNPNVGIKTAMDFNANSPVPTDKTTEQFHFLDGMFRTFYADLF